MAPMPEPMPVTTTIGCRRVRGRVLGKQRAEAGADLRRWALRPPEPPEPMVRAEATIFTITARKRSPRGLWWTAEIAASVP